MDSSLLAAADKLTLREIEVLALVAEGFTNDAIARKLYVNKTTVETYLRRAYTKLNAKNRAHVITLAMRAGVIT